MKKIFVAGPYNNSDKSLMEQRLKSITQYCLKLFLDGQAPVSPLLIGLNMAKEGDLPTDTETWKEYSRGLLKGCDEIHILLLDDWFKSSGVQYEIDHAKSLNIEIKFIAI